MARGNYGYTAGRTARLGSALILGVVLGQALTPIPWSTLGSITHAVCVSAFWILDRCNLALAYQCRNLGGFLAWLGLAMQVAAQQEAKLPFPQTASAQWTNPAGCVQGGLYLVRIYRRESTKRYRAKIEYVLDAPSLPTKVRIEPHRSNALLVFSNLPDSLNSGQACSVGELWMIEQGRVGLVPGPLRPADPDLRSYYRSQGIERQINLPHPALAQRWVSPPLELFPGPADPGDRVALLVGRYQEKLAQLMEQRIRDPVSRGLSQALLLGWKAGLDRGTKLAFQQSGTVHLLAVSGMHVLLIHGWVLLFLGGAYRLAYHQGSAHAPAPWVRLVGTSLPVLGYCLLTGGASSAWRAGLVVSWMEATRAMAGTHNGGLALFQAATCMLAFDPFCWQDPGFILSFGAVSGLLWLHRPLAALLNPVLSKGLPRMMLLSSLLTISAQFVTTPITLYYFKQFPLYFLPANWVVVPLSGPLLAIALAWTALGNLPCLGWFIQTIGTSLFGLTLRVTGFFARLPGAVLETPMFVTEDMIWLMGLVLAVMLLVNQNNRHTNLKRWFWGLLLGALGWQISCQARQIKDADYQKWSYHPLTNPREKDQKPQQVSAWIHRSPTVFQAGSMEPWPWKPIPEQPEHQTILASGSVELHLVQRVDLLVLHQGANVRWMEPMAPVVVVLSGFYPNEQRLELIKKCMKDGVTWFDLCSVRQP